MNLRHGAVDPPLRPHFTPMQNELLSHRREMCTRRVCHFSLCRMYCISSLLVKLPFGSTGSCLCPSNAQRAALMFGCPTRTFLAHAICLLRSRGAACRRTRMSSRAVPGTRTCRDHAIATAQRHPAGSFDFAQVRRKIPLANHFLQTNFSACYRHLTLWEQNANSNTAPDGERKGRVSGTTAVGPQAGWRRYLPSMAASAMLSNF